MTRKGEMFYFFLGLVLWHINHCWLFIGDLLTHFVDKHS